MQQIAVSGLVVRALLLSAGVSGASWGEMSYSGCQPWWNVFNQRQAPEEERLQKFWHDYYDAMKNYYGAPDHIDWVAYYKNHGYQLNPSCGPGGCPGCGRINYAPVNVAPNLQWAVPGGVVNGPPGPNGAACAAPPTPFIVPPVYSPGHE